MNADERWEFFKLPNDRLGRYAVLQSNDRGARPVIGTNFRTEERARLAAAAPALRDAVFHLAGCSRRLHACEECRKIAELMDTLQNQG